jgi:phospholipid-transporting ATPase
MDREANFTKVKVVKDGEIKEIHSKDINVGDIVRVEKEERFPADLIILSSSEPAGIAYLETSNVDGESNLKVRFSNRNTAHLTDETSLSNYKAIVKCEHPNESIYKFEGIISNGKNSFSLDQSNLLLRGAALKNTAWIYGVVVYTGHQTKIMMNSSGTPSKRTKMQKETDKQYIFISAGLFFLTLICAIMNAYYASKLKSHWYLCPVESGNNSFKFIQIFFSYLLLLNTLVPISLTVTLEFVKFLFLKIKY